MRIELPQLNKSIEAKKEDSLFKNLKDAEVPIASSCKGDGVCGKCVVRLEKGSLPPANALELALQKKYALDPDQRISCQCLITEDIAISTSYW